MPVIYGSLNSSRFFSRSMRKVIVELIPNAEYRRAMEDIFNKIKSIEILQMLNIDFDIDTKLFIGLFTLKDGFSLPDLENLDKFGAVHDVIKIDGNKYTCLVKAKPPSKIIKYNRPFSRDLIWDTPIIVAEDRLVLSVIGNKDDLKWFFEAVKTVGKIENIICQLATYHAHNILSCLTDRQREVILEAKKNGYYEYPRRINSDQLARILGIHKAATIEHLRKAEIRIMSNILSCTVLTEKY